MNRRQTTRRVIVLMAALAAVPLGRLAASAQTSPAGTSTTTGEDAWVAPRTADGQPDLQGLWNNTTITPFERRAGQAEFIAESDAVAAERSAIERRAQANAPSMPRTELLPAGGSTGSVNQFWFGPRYQIVGSRRSSLVIDPPDGRVPLRSEAEMRRDYLVEHRTDTVENMSVYSRCITRGVPGTMFPQAYNNGYQILQIPGFVVIRAEMMHVRIIPLDVGPHVSEQIRGWMGDSRGHWDGDTLVVETTNFDPKGWISSNASAGRLHGVPQSDSLRVVERFTRVDEDTINWQATIEDPDVYTAPWTVEVPFDRRPDYVIYEYACHEGNHAVQGVMGAERVVERRATAR
ncbi:MAG: hypothetical protein ABGY72_17825 [bacterium]